MSKIINKTIWLVGASSGIGRALALQLVAEGNFVIVSARRQDKLDELVALHPSKMETLAFDATKDSHKNEITSQLKHITDVVDIVIVAAGTVEYEDDTALDVAMYRRVFDANFFGLVNTLAIAKPFLEASEHRAYIVGLSSLSMMIGFSRAEAYGASKAAADYFLHSLFVDLPKRKFDVSIVRPGFVKTPMTSVNDFPMPFIMSPEQAAQRIVKGMEKRQRLIVFPRRLSFILGIFSLFSSLWYGYIAPKTSRNSL